MKIPDTLKDMICMGNQCLMIIEALEKQHIKIPENPAAIVAKLTNEMTVELDAMKEELAAIAEQQTKLAAEKAAAQTLSAAKTFYTSVRDAKTVEERKQLSAKEALKGSLTREKNRIQKEFNERKDEFEEQINDLKENYRINLESFETYIKEVTVGYLTEGGYGHKFVYKKCAEMEDIMQEYMEPALNDLVTEIANGITESAAPAVLGSAVDNVIYKICLIVDHIIKIAKYIKEIAGYIKTLRDIMEELRIPEFSTIPDRITALNASSIISFVPDNSLGNAVSKYDDQLSQSRDKFASARKSIADNMQKNYSCIDDKRKMYARYYYNIEEDGASVYAADIYRKNGEGNSDKDYIFLYHIDYPAMDMMEILAMGADETEKIKKETESGKQKSTTKTNLKVKVTSSGKVYISE